MQGKEKKKEDNNEKDKGRNMVTIPYIKGLTEKMRRVFMKHGVNVAIKPIRTIKSVVRNIKDVIPFNKKTDCIYEIPCGSCEKTYVGETGREIETRLKEHKTEVEKVTGHKFTRSRKDTIKEESFKSAVAEHAAIENHVIDWEKSKAIGLESNRFKRWIKEAIEICKRKDKSMNRVAGTYQLDRSWNVLIENKDQKHKQKKKEMGRREGSRQITY